MRREINKIKEGEKTATLEALYQAADRVRGDKAATQFINEILTESEKITIGRRILIANLILKGHKQSEIHNMLSVSPNTFSRIRQWLSGRFVDYDKTLKNTAKPEKKKKTYKKIEPFTFEHLKRNYPMHCLLFTLSKKTLDHLRK